MPVPTVSPAPATATTPSGWSFWWWIGIAGLLVGITVVARRFRRAQPSPQPKDVIETPVERPLAVPAPRARLALALRPTRAGLNMLSATVDAEIVVTNEGDAPAADIRIAMTLLAAHARQDVALAEIYTRPVGRPAAPPFALAPGKSRTIRAIAALAREGIEPLTAAGRPMLVPLAAVTCLYDTGEGRGQTSQAFAIGVERVDSAKLAPFWLDAPARIHDQVAARAQGPVVRR